MHSQSPGTRAPARAARIYTFCGDEFCVEAAPPLTPPRCRADCSTSESMIQYRRSRTGKLYPRNPDREVIFAAHDAWRRLTLNVDWTGVRLVDDDGRVPKVRHHGKVSARPSQFGGTASYARDRRRCAFDHPPQQITDPFEKRAALLVGSPGQNNQSAKPQCEPCGASRMLRWQFLISCVCLQTRTRAALRTPARVRWRPKRPPLRGHHVATAKVQATLHSRARHQASSWGRTR